MKDKILHFFEELQVDVLHIAQSYAKDNKSPQIEPAHLFRALLHKSIGLIDFIENTLDEDYYYLVDWCDMRMQQCDKSPYGMKGIEFSYEAKMVVKEAMSISDECGVVTSDVKLLLAALVKPGVGFSAEQLKTMPLKAEKVISSFSVKKCKNIDDEILRNEDANISTSSEYLAPMFSNTHNLRIIGFDRELHSMLEVLARKDRANLLIVGETGVGKTSLINCLLNLVSEKKLPVSLSNIELFELDLIALSQGVTYKGEIEDRFKSILEILFSKVHPILVIENFHRVEDKQSVLNGIVPYLKKILSKNQMQVICTATVDGYTKDIEKDKELVSYFEKLNVDVPSIELAREILQSKCKEYESFHNLLIDKEVPAEVVRLAKRYMTDKSLPSSAIDLLDRAMAALKVQKELESENDNEKEALLTIPDVRDVVSKMTGIPMGSIQTEERQKLANAESILHRHVIGQNHAIKSILDAVFESRSGLNKKGQPIGAFFFLGPTGTGKTELAKALADFLFNDETAILRFDMSEYKEEHSVALLYGAPPGYIGYEEGGLLVNQIRRHPYSIVLFDEIEKAHKSVFDLFLQILDEGKLHDRLGRVGDFSNSLIIFTSNIGSDFIFNSFDNDKIPTHDQLLDIMQGVFRPEFLARLTEIIPFSPITEEMIDKIFDIHIKNLLKLLDEQHITLEIDKTAREYVSKVGFNRHYGARPILGIIRKEIRRPLSKLIIAGEIKSGDTITMKYNKDDNEIIWDIDTPDN
jgi:ATP-dependent Clp protease ATP-binding subunit ClpA